MLALQMRAPVGVQILLFPALKSDGSSKPILRVRRRPFHASTGDGPYRLPKAVQDHLERELAAFRNAEAAFALAAFLGRFWTTPNRLGMPFPIDRRALGRHQVLDLTEGEVRGAIRTLGRIGFLARPISGKGSRYRPTPDGLKRKAILFEFGGGIFERLPGCKSEGPADFRPETTRRPPTEMQLPPAFHCICN